MQKLAREWLLFLLLLPLGFLASYSLGYWQLESHGRAHQLRFDHLFFNGFDDFWNHTFGLDNPWSMLTWLVPYAFVLLVRSIWASIKLAAISKRALLVAGAYILLVAVGLTALAMSEFTAAKQRQQAHRPNWFEANSPFADSIPKQQTGTAPWERYKAKLPSYDELVPNGKKPIDLSGLPDQPATAKPTATVSK